MNVPIALSAFRDKTENIKPVLSFIVPPGKIFDGISNRCTKR